MTREEMVESMMSDVAGLTCRADITEGVPSKFAFPPSITEEEPAVSDPTTNVPWSVEKSHGYAGDFRYPAWYVKDSTGAVVCHFAIGSDRTDEQAEAIARTVAVGPDAERLMREYGPVPEGHMRCGKCRVVTPEDDCDMWCACGGDWDWGREDYVKRINWLIGLRKNAVAECDRLRAGWDAANRVAELATRNRDQLRAEVERLRDEEAGKMRGIMNAVWEFAEAECGHKSHSARHGFSTIAEWVTKAKVELTALRVLACDLAAVVQLALRLTIEHARPTSDEGYRFSNRVTQACRDVLANAAPVLAPKEQPK